MLRATVVGTHLAHDVPLCGVWRSDYGAGRGVVLCHLPLHRGGAIFDLGFVVMSPHVASLAVVFPITFFTGFWLNRNVAFRVTEVGSGMQLVRYALSVVGSILLNYVCIKLFVEVLGIWPTPAKALTTAVCVIYSYLAGRYFTFKKKTV